MGQAGLTIQNVEGKEELEIGYLLKRKYRNRGYASLCLFYRKKYIDCIKENLLKVKLDI